MAERQDWHLDKKITVSLIFALLANATASVWWAARMDSTVRQQGQQIMTLTANDAALSANQNSVGENLARIQEGQKYQTEMLRELKEDVKRGGK